MVALKAASLHFAKVRFSSVALNGGIAGVTLPNSRYHSPRKVNFALIRARTRSTACSGLGAQARFWLMAARRFLFVAHLSPMGRILCPTSTRQSEGGRGPFNRLIKRF